MQRGAFHARHKLHRAGVPNVLNEAIDDVVAKVAMGHLAAPEAKRRLHFVTLAEEAHSLVLLSLVVVLVHRDGELDFLNGDDLLLLARRSLALVLLIEKLAVVLNAADGRNGVGRNLNQIEAALACNFQGFKGWHDAELLASIVDDAHFARADSFIDADELFGRTLIDGFPPKAVAGFAN